MPGDRRDLLMIILRADSPAATIGQGADEVSIPF
jgi:hypothetical protein